jgi:hypothetical protein
VPGAVVVHRYEFSRNKGKFYLIDRNRLILVLTTYSAAMLWLLAPLLVVQELAMWVLAAKEGWLKERRQSVSWLVRHFGWLRRRRRVVAAKRTAPDSLWIGLLSVDLATAYAAMITPSVTVDAREVTTWTEEPLDCDFDDCYRIHNIVEDLVTYPLTTTMLSVPVVCTRSSMLFATEAPPWTVIRPSWSEIEPLLVSLAWAVTSIVAPSDSSRTARVFPIVSVPVPLTGKSTWFVTRIVPMSSPLPTTFSVAPDPMSRVAVRREALVPTAMLELPEATIPTVVALA